MRTAHTVARRKRMSPEDAEDFVSWVVIRLMERDFALIRSCLDRRAMRSYLRTVIGNLGRDYCDHLWGRWRPSETARRLGTDAVELEKLVHRDGLEVREAITIQRQRTSPLGDAQRRLEEQAMRLPPRQRRAMVELDEQQHAERDPIEARLIAREGQEERARLFRLLNRAFCDLGEQDRAMLALHHLHGKSLASAARHLGLDPRRIYQRRKRCLRVLRSFLYARGVAWTDVEKCLGDFFNSPENDEACDLVEVFVEKARCSSCTGP